MMRIRLTILTLVCAFCFIAFPVGEVDGREPRISFSRDIRPILSNKCFECHGPDENARQSELRLDLESGVKSVARRRGSKLWHRISTNDLSDRMPPVDFDKTLDRSEIALIRDWLREGAEWETHWAFEPIKSPPLPRHTSWGNNEIDGFIFEAMEKRGLLPSTETDPHTLIRRVSLDLIGIPATPDEIAYWIPRVADADGGIDQQGYAELIESLVNRPEYGERWARRWLDLARYADTNGYEKDRDRPMWPYRDWVIKAINSGMSFKQFTIEQIAGDMLPNATVNQRIATGFHRNTMLNEEGGIDPLEFRFYAMTDRVATTGTTWLGLTTGCAQCHTHKYDPITHREYYELMALLDNTDEPEIDIRDDGLERDYEKRVAAAKKLSRELESKWPGNVEGAKQSEIDSLFETWLKEQRQRVHKWTPLIPKRMHTNLPLLTHEGDGIIFGTGDSTKHDVYDLEFDVEGDGITGIRIEALPDPRLPAYGPGMTYYEGTHGNFFLTEFELTVNGEQEEFDKASHSYAKNRFGNQEAGALQMIDGDIQTGWSVNDKIGERHVSILSLVAPASSGDWHIRLHFGRHYSSSLGKFRLSVSTEVKAFDAHELPPSIEKLLNRQVSELTEEETGLLRQEFLMTREEVKQPALEITELRKRPAYQRALVMKERPANNPRETFIHPRGEFRQQSELVTGGVPSVLPPIKALGSPSRREFAEWLVSDENPLTARVVANRAWSAFFGRGIVETLDDFGFQGKAPTHPALLEYLASEFNESGWNMRWLHKQIVLSATYQQSTIPSAEGLETDPENIFLSHMPRVRLDAEVIRDSILLASGVLSKKMYGPPVKPPQPEGISDIAFGSPKWKASSGEERYRRSIYTYTKRTTPFAMFTTFDAPSGENCTAQRERSNSALQALTLLNDVMFVDAARQLGKRIAEAKGDERDKVQELFLRVLGRAPDEVEMADTVAFYLQQLITFQRDLESANTLVGPDHKDVSEVAAWTLVSRAMFSLDETINRN